MTGSTSLMFGGSGSVTLTRPFWRRLLKSPALSPLTRKSSASIGRNNGSSAFGSPRRRNSRSRNLASTSAGESWKWLVAMWQSAQARPFAPRPSSPRSKNARWPRTTALHGSPPQSAGTCSDSAPGSNAETAAANRELPARIASVRTTNRRLAASRNRGFKAVLLSESSGGSCDGPPSQAKASFAFRN